MKCWYIIDHNCQRPPGICEGCEDYERWCREREQFYESIRKEEIKEYDEKTRQGRAKYLNFQNNQENELPDTCNPVIGGHININAFRGE